MTRSARGPAITRFWRIARHPLLIAAVLAALLALFALALLYPAGPDGRPSEALIRRADVKSIQAHIQAMLEKNRVEDDQPNTFQITVSNNSPKPLNPPLLSLDAPGFALDQKALVCRDASGNAVHALAPRQSCQFSLALAPACRSGTYGVTVWLLWSQADTRDQLSLLLGPITIDRGWSAAQFARAGRRFAGIVKDLALPIVLAILGAFFAARQSDREARRKAQQDQLERVRAQREKDAEAKRIEADKKQAERQEVGRLLLTRILDLARMHYLPFVAQSKSILGESIKKRAGGADADFEKLFFHLLLLLKHMEVFRLKEGGVFFKRRDGEKAMTAAWYLLKTTSYRGLGGDEIVAKALEKVKCDWDYATYKAALPGPELQAVWTKFQEWRKVAEDSADAESLWQILGVIDAFQAIASFEADFALKYWYEGANQERDPKAKLFMLQGKTEIYYRKTHDPQDLAHTLQDQLQTLYQREVETKPIN
jgi:hypothetical protein